jgi:hypothetical protein
MTMFLMAVFDHRGSPAKERGGGHGHFRETGCHNRPTGAVNTWRRPWLWIADHSMPDQGSETWEKTEMRETTFLVAITTANTESDK